jgi:peptide/nickel transport system permease protein
MAAARVHVAPVANERPQALLDREPLFWSPIGQLTSSMLGLLRRVRSVLRSHRFATFLVGRLTFVIMLGFGITLIAFALTNLVPGDPALANLGPEQASNPDAVKAFKQHYGLDQPLPAQYWLFLVHLAHGDLGQSEQSHRPVVTDLEQYVPATAELAVTSTLLALVLGIALGTLAAVRRRKPIDHLLRVVSLALTSTPTFWLGLVALYFFFFKLGWLPSNGRLDPTIDVPPHVTGLYTVDSLLAGDLGTFVNSIQHLLLPALVLAAYNVGLLTRFTRAAVLEVAQEDYITVVRAKGVPEITVLRHLLRSALPPVVTIVGLLFADAMTGTVLVETIFAWPGIGRYAFHAATTLDLPAIMGVTLFIATVFITANLVVDVLYGIMDPRLRIA